MQSSSSRTLPSISDLLTLPRRSSNSATLSGMNQPHPMTINSNHNMNVTNNFHHSYGERNNANNKISGYHLSLKAKRKRASPSQLSVLNQVFSQTYFPSTELRIELGKHLGMSPRTVQIWFQNKRQSLRSRTRRYSFSSLENGEIEIDEDDNPTTTSTTTTAAIYYPQRSQNDTMAASPSSSSSLWSHHDHVILPPPSSSSRSSSPLSSSSSPVIKDEDHDHQPQHHHQKINLPPLRLHQSAYYPPSPPSSTYSSPISIDSILH